MFLLKPCKDKDGTPNPRKLKQGKAFVAERIRNEIARDPIPYKNDILVSIMVTIGIIPTLGTNPPR